MEDDSKSILTRIASAFLLVVIIGVSISFYINDDLINYRSEYGYLGVFLLCLLCNATVFAPAPSLIVVITAAQRLKPALVVLCGALGITLGELTGYCLGKAGRFLKNDSGITAKWVDKYGWIAVFAFAAVPLPAFDAVGIYSGFSNMNIWKFLLACFGGKLIKVIVYVYGSIAVIDAF